MVEVSKISANNTDLTSNKIEKPYQDLKNNLVSIWNDSSESVSNLFENDVRSVEKKPANITAPAEISYPKTKTEKELDINSIKQKPKACGTTSLAMVLNYFGKDVSPDELDNQVRKGNYGTTVSLVQEAAEKQGVNAVVLNNSNYEEIKEHVDKGHGIMAVVDSFERRTDGKTHFLVISGYREENGKRQIQITNTNGKDPTWQDYDDFVENRWSQVDIYGIDTGRDNLAIVFSTEDDLPKERFEGKARSFDQVQTGTSQIANGRESLKEKNEKEAVEGFSKGGANTCIGLQKSLLYVPESLASLDTDRIKTFKKGIK
jgi:hypothetical protein